MSNVYSYLRFSSLKQKAGTSVDRQMDYARQWAEKNGMRLDESLTMRDEGLSAYHQRHIKSGALGVFLEAISAGRIPAGSVLIVEGLDRLSRAEPILAQAQMAQIINADITVVTAFDGKRYNRESLKANPMDLVYSLLIMIRAHEESETKSQRARAAIRKHCETWGSDQQRPVAMGRAPQWLAREGGRWVIVEERATAIRRAIDLFRLGHGHRRITETLQAEGLSLTGSAPVANQLYRIIRNPALAGIKGMAVGDETFSLTGFYPALVSQAEFSELQVMMADRARTRGTQDGGMIGIVTGLGITTCGYCGGMMTACNVMSRARQDGLLSDGNRRIMCSCYTTRKPCPHPASMSVVPVEQAIMAYCADRMNLSALISGGDRQAPARARLASAKSAASEIEAQLAKITEALIAASDAAPLVFVRKARELEEDLARIKAEVTAAEHEVTAMTRQATPDMANTWAVLISGVKAMDNSARMMARQLVRDTFERIIVCVNGPEPKYDVGNAALLLRSKAGITRMLLINRKTGEWKAAEDLSAF